VLVPFPSSKADLAFSNTNRTTTLANAIGAEYGHGVTVCDVLRFDQPIPSANEQGGTREAEILYEHLRLTGSVKDQRVVMIDDVLTSGGHLRAGVAKLLTDGHASEVMMAICAGRADQAQVADPFAIRHEDIEEYWP
jgi:predicted amidophosphoribosyltransferase